MNVILGLVDVLVEIDILMDTSRPFLDRALDLASGVTGVRMWKKCCETYCGKNQCYATHWKWAVSVIMNNTIVGSILVEDLVDDDLNDVAFE